FGTNKLHKMKRLKWNRPGEAKSRLPAFIDGFPLDLGKIALSSLKIRVSSIGFGFRAIMVL
ncbi:hypothetical protein, partial [uncultured Mucilaginibacter sp.]|uniref:hypothetical protein n=1 Tax=uncultured Mucilaginibacter sp. TaxID=797541 RepID=UPI0025CEE66E